MSEKWTKYEYFKEMGISAGSEKHKNALNRAHEIRQFEINLYWERSKYMYVMVGAVFVGVYTAKEPHIQILLSFVGMVFSMAWVLINKGSRFWQENWESHIDYLEDEFEGKLYKIVAVSDPRKDSFSVSKINLWLSIFVFLIFTFCFLLKINDKAQWIIWKWTGYKDVLYDWGMFFGGVFAVLFVLNLVGDWCCFAKANGRVWKQFKCFLDLEFVRTSTETWEESSKNNHLPQKELGPPLKEFKIRSNSGK